MTTALVKLIAWALAAAVTFATLGPATLRPHAPLGHDGEHVFAFLLVGIAFGFAYAHRRRFVATVSVVMIGLLEVLQLWVPGRHARVEDFVVDALAACFGVTIAAGLEWIHARWSPSGTT
jgi:VanZ family protein